MENLVLRFMKKNKLTKTVTLFWSNRNKKILCFQDELEKLEKEMENFSCILVMSRQNDWNGEKGRINGPLLQKYLTPLKGKEYFLCGPLEMRCSVLKDLIKMNVHPRHIHYEVFGF